MKDRHKDHRQPNRQAKGRSLKEFGELSVAEKEILQGADLGKAIFVGIKDPNQFKRPEEKSQANVVRADFLRFLILGGDENTPIHEWGIRVYCAWVTGDLDLQFCEIPKPFALDLCVLEGEINLVHAQAKSIRLNGSMIHSLNGDGLRCSGGIFLKRWFYSYAGIRLVGAQIDGSLECSGGRFATHGARSAIDLDITTITGSLHPNWDSHLGSLTRFQAEGAVRLGGAKIGGDLDCQGGLFNNPDEFSIVADGAEVGGAAKFTSAHEHSGPILVDGQPLKFQSFGTIRLVCAHIKGDLEFFGADLSANNGHALFCDSAIVGRRLLFRESPQEGYIFPISVRGQISLNGATVGILVDDFEIWGKASALDLDNFRYDRFAAVSPTNVEKRIEWLMHQRSDYLEDNFTPQPWQHLADVYERAGRDEEAKITRIKMRTLQRKARWRNKNGLLRVWAFLTTRFDWLLGVLVGYGYRPWRSVWSLLMIWLVSALVFHIAGNFGQIVPADSKIVSDQNIPEQCKINLASLSGPPTESEADKIARHTFTVQLNNSANASLPWPILCKRLLPASFVTFSPALYSLDILVPLLDLRMKSQWTERLSDNEFSWGQLLRAWRWTEIFCGLFLSLILAASVSGITKKN